MIRNLFVFLVSFLASGLIAEAVLRQVFNPMDYLAVETVPDPVLNHKIAPYASGHDGWGYRNAGVPENTDIMAIGDSMTYGIMATSAESWPVQLQTKTGKTVYNAALGGYGPLHYLHILKTRALKLSPKQVIVMLYWGNDFLDAYNLTYSNENWIKYRQINNTESVNPDLFLPREDPKPFLGAQRNWLAQHSVLYRLVTQNALLDGLRTRKQLGLSNSAFQVTHLGEPVVLDPVKRLKFVDIEDPRIIEALEITKRALAEFSAFCTANGTSLQVALMPVREHVYLPIIQSQLEGQKLAQMQRLTASLETIRRDMTDFLIREQINYTDLYEILGRALETQAVYPPADGHPNGIGYGVIAAALAQEIE